MALIIAIVILLLPLSITHGKTRDPFPQGYLMATQGTILQDNWISSREPWLPSVLFNDEKWTGFSIGAISYYDRMDNLENRSLYRIYGGTWFELKQMRVNLFLSQFDAFGIYYEKQLYTSIGTQFLENFRFSVNLTGSKTGIHTASEQHQMQATSGFSALYRFKIVSIMTSIENILLKGSNRNSVNQDVLLKCGIHTQYNRIGAQGIIINFKPNSEGQIQFILGEEFRFSDRIGIHASISNNPIFIGIGLFAGFKKSDFIVGLINNPDLGWSRGFSALYSK